MVIINIIYTTLSIFLRISSNNITTSLRNLYQPETPTCISAWDVYISLRHISSWDTYMHISLRHLHQSETHIILRHLHAYQSEAHIILRHLHAYQSETSTSIWDTYQPEAPISAWCTYITPKVQKA